MASGKIKNDSGVLADTSSVQNLDGSKTYTGTFKGLDVEWVDGYGTHQADGEAVITITLPSGAATPGPGGVFRFADNGGYNIHLSGSDWSIDT